MSKYLIVGRREMKLQALRIPEQVRSVFNVKSWIKTLYNIVFWRCLATHFQAQNEWKCAKTKRKNHYSGAYAVTCFDAWYLFRSICGHFLASGRAVPLFRSICGQSLSLICWRAIFSGAYAVTFWAAKAQRLFSGACAVTFHMFQRIFAGVFSITKILIAKILWLVKPRTWVK